MLRFQRAPSSHHLALEGRLTQAGKSGNVALRRLGPAPGRAPPAQGAHEHIHERKQYEDFDEQDQRMHHMLALASTPPRGMRKPGPAGQPPSRLWPRGLPAFRTWGTVAM